jgi:hypothetical protein
MKLREMSAQFGSKYSNTETAMYRNASLSVAYGSDTCSLAIDEDRRLLVVLRI